MLDLTRAETGRLVHPQDPEPWSSVAKDAGADSYLAAYANRRESEAILAGRGSPARAVAVLRAAHRGAAHVGAAPLLSRITDLAARARIHVGEPTEPATGKAGGATEARVGDRLGLTRRETEVLHLIGRGLSNTQIAKTLYISPKTASVHVSNILRKLAVTSRVQAAAIAHRTGLTD
jgi:DNA-binding NarL/FixJ family response regulator